MLNGSDVLMVTIRANTTRENNSPEMFVAALYPLPYIALAILEHSVAVDHTELEIINFKTFNIMLKF